MKTLSDYGIVVEAGETRALCPVCSPDRHKSYDKCLSVDSEKGLWFCHHCGWSGGIGGTDNEKHDAEKAFKKPHFVKSEIKDEKVLEWFKSRGISEKTLAHFDIKSGMAWMHGNPSGEANTIQFPFYLNGEVVNVKYRTGDKRFRQEKNARKCFYNYDNALKSTSKRLLIVEGELDCLSLSECGYGAVVSVPDGAPSPDAKSYATKFDFLLGAEKLFEKFDAVVLAVDGDAAGKRLEEELSRRIGLEKCYQVSWPEGCKDANDVLVSKGVGVLRSVIDGATPFPVEGVATVRDLWSAVYDKRHNPSPGGVDIGWDNAYGKFNVELGQMTVVTGIPGHGKSTWVDALRVKIFERVGWPSAAFSPENWPAEDHLSTLSEMYSKENFYSMSDENIHNSLVDLMDALYFIQPEKDEDMMSVEEILKRAKSLIYRHGVKVLVIDPWNEIDHNFSGDREDLYISKNLAKIRRFARMNMIHVFLIVHPSKLQKDKDGGYPPPTPYDISGGAMWRNKADNILCVYRPDMKTSETVVFVHKIRFKRNGSAGSEMKFKYHVDTSTYYPQAD